MQKRGLNLPTEKQKKDCLSDFWMNSTASYFLITLFLPGLKTIVSNTSYSINQCWSRVHKLKVRVRNNF